MKLLKLLLFAFGIGMLFVTCKQHEIDSNLEIQEESISSLERTISTNEMSEFAPLGVIPEWAREKMSPEECELWGIMSRQFKVDYSFLNMPYYVSNREGVTTKIRNICEAINNGEIPESEYGISFSVICPKEYNANLFDGVERLSNNEGGGIGETKNWTCSVFKNDNVSHEFYIIYTRTKSEIIEHASSFTSKPSSASFHGAQSHRIDINGYVHINCIGYIAHDGKEYDINHAGNHLLP